MLQMNPAVFSSTSGPREINEESGNRVQRVTLKILILATVACEGAYKYLPGPTLIDLAKEALEPLLVFILIFCARSVGTILGIIIGSFINEWLLRSNQKSLFMFLTMFLMSASSFFISSTAKFDGLLMLFFAAGFCRGLLDTGINAISLHSRISHRSPFFGVISLSYGVGALMSPVIARNYIQERVNITWNEVIKRERVNIPFTHEIWNFGYVSLVSEAYVVLGSVIFLVALSWLIYYCIAIDYTSIYLPEFRVQNNSVIQWNLTVLNASILTFATEAIAFGYLIILPSHIVIHFENNQKQALNYAFLFLGFLCLGRAANILFSMRTSPPKMLSTGILLVFCGIAILYIDAQYDHTLFCIANGVIGVGVGPMFINIYLWLICKFAISHHSINPMFIAEALAEAVTPWLLCRLLWTQPENLKHFMLIAAVTIATLFLLQYYVLIRGGQSEECPSCIQEAVLPVLSLSPSLMLPQEAIINRIIQPQSLEFDETFLHVFGFSDTKDVFEDFSALKQRIEQSNRKIKSAIRLLEYSGKN